MRNPVAIAAVSLAAIAAIYLALDPFGAPAGPPSQPANSDIVAGETLYREYCAVCHGVNLEGQENWQSEDANGVMPPPPHDETGHTWHHGDGLLIGYVKLGGQESLAKMGVEFNSGMPGFADILSDEEIWDILAYIKSTWSERIREVQNDRTRAEQMGGDR